jgi:phosphoenolpyruvate-protein kinase (PTS system EI component)
MHHRLSLSGEIPPKSILCLFDGIGLIRSEYVLRAEGHFITTVHAQQVIGSYVARLAELCPDAPIWYRMSEMTSQEANILVGVDQHYVEADFMKGRRGVRRARELPAAFETELRIITNVARVHPNLHVITPFVRDADDFAFVVDTLDRAGWPNRFGSMIEIPSALFDVPQMIAMGASNFLLGLNDLSSLLTGTTRELPDMKLHPSVWRAVGEVREHVAEQCEWGIAGNLSTAVLDRAMQAGVPYVSEHYSDLPALRGIDPGMLPDVDFAARTKALTRAQIAQAEENALQARLARHAGAVGQP